MKSVFDNNFKKQFLKIFFINCSITIPFFFFLIFHQILDEIKLRIFIDSSSFREKQKPITQNHKI